MAEDRAFKMSLVVSFWLHVGTMLVFSFVIVLDLGTVEPLVELTYVGAAESSRVLAEVMPENQMEMPSPPRVNLPDRLFATESVVSSAGDEEVPLPVLSEKVDMVRNYRRGAPEHIRLDIRDPASVVANPFVLAADERFTVEGALARRKIVVRPVKPEYPEGTVSSDQEADMKFRIKVGPRGFVESVERVDDIGSPRVNLVISSYIRQWRFESRALGTESESGIISIKFRLK